MLSVTISVVVPVYNAERYLNRCIDSILAQTFTRFELIIVNDGSTDESKAICEQYSLSDERIRLINKPNGGVSSARNIGMDNAVGEYITFVDSDDHLGDRFLERFFILNISVKNTLVQQGYIYEFRQARIQEKINFATGIFLDNQFSDLFLSVDLTRDIPHPWSKLFDLRVIRDNNLRFNELIHYGEDNIFVMDYISCINQIVLLESSEYHYSFTFGSLSYIPASYETEINLFQTLRDRFKMLESRFNLDTRARDYYDSQFARYLIRALYSLYTPRYRKSWEDRLKILHLHRKSDNSKLIRKFRSPYKTDHIFRYLFNIKSVMLSDFLLFLFSAARLVHLNRLYKSKM